MHRMNWLAMATAVLMTSAAAASVTIATASAAAAGTVAALIDGSSIAWIDIKNRKVTGSVRIDGGARLVGIDVRPADGKLYGLTADGQIVTIDPQSGKWQRKSQLSEKLPANAAVVVDFNPVADRLRVIGSEGTNLRVNVDDGKAIVDGRLKYADGDKGAGRAPRVTAAGYTNSHPGTKATALYDVDAANGWLLKQAPPNDGILVTVGALGVPVDGPIALDIWSDGKGGNAAWLLSGGRLYEIDLATGAAKTTGAIEGLGGKVIDMAILPPA
ncbi:MAG: DUF4394 domain-containing protein [Hyphomicrobiaceae bacterium]|nr:DUF4394 domain-containing protein [Hyphomicrobiaceae bacterium]